MIYNAHDTVIENVHSKKNSFHYDIDDEGDSWKATYAIMRVPLPEA